MNRRKIRKFFYYFPVKEGIKICEHHTYVKSTWERNAIRLRRNSMRIIQWVASLGSRVALNAIMG